MTDKMLTNFSPIFHFHTPENIYNATPKGSLKKLNNLSVGLNNQLLVTTPTIIPTSLDTLIAKDPKYFQISHLCFRCIDLETRLCYG